MLQRILVFVAAVAAAGSASAQQLLHTWPGKPPVESYGISLASAGDVNGDGLDDVLIGLDGAMSGYPYADVRSGGSGEILHHLGFYDLDPQPNHVASVGDVNGDGFADVLVGTGTWSIAGIGRARVTSGVDGAVIYDYSSAVPHDGLGWSVCGLGDVNGDGVPDFAIGSWDITGMGIADPGRVRIHSGATGALLHELIGLAVGDRFGVAIASAGDVNGDGIPDPIAGAPQTGVPLASGYARVYFGAVTLGYHLTSPHGGVADFGAAVGTPGDLDRDGYAELIVGAPGTTGGGRADIFSGATGIHQSGISGGSGSSLIGISVFGVGDPDLDGRADYAVGSMNGIALLSGAGHLLLYPSSGLAEAGMESYGIRSACAGDTNGDGVPEVVLQKYALPPIGIHVDLVSLLPVGTELFGESTPSCRGPHALRPATKPVIGNGIFHVNADRVMEGVRALLLVSDGADVDGSDSLGFGLPIFVAIDASLTGYPLLHVWNEAPMVKGYAAARLLIPNDPSLVGTTFYVQGLFLNERPCAAAPLGTSSTDAIAITIEQP